MISSMTGYANASRELQGASLVLEMRAVNHRYLEVMFRSPDEVRAIEPQCRELIASRLSRGKVEVRISFNRPAEAQTSLQLNMDMIGQLFAVSESVRAIRPEVGELKIGEILRWPGILQTQEVSGETLQQIALELLRQALDDFTATRRREGEKLVALILDRVISMEALVETVKPKIPALGKRLDFLLQELNREANTLGSKSVSSEVSQTAMELKVLIEQIREQIQNIE